VKNGPLAISLGDPAGVGPEIIVKAWSQLRGLGSPFLVVGDYQSLASASGAAGVRRVTTPQEAMRVFADALPVLDIPLRTPVVAGQPSAGAAPSIIKWIETGVGLALSGAVSALVTAPIAKAPLYAAGFRFPGHTEFLGELTAAERYDGARGPIMMLAAQDLRATLVTVHEPLSRVPSLLSVEKIVNAALVTAQAWGPRTRRSSPPPSAPCATLASTPRAPHPPTPCSPPRCAAATTRWSACTTTRP
jgi:4-hydroxythreonine-4-phosphate dehydrogenase